ncbi:MAG: Ig-like domain-containing protein [Candidatus Thermoplasmatota archaeon]|nr:Ig-like domain-containing protein [Candidatus Thermoplasmatota archaeon]
MQSKNIVTMLLVILLIAMAQPATGDRSEGDPTRGTLDAYVAGTVLNATGGHPVSVSSRELSSNMFIYFNGTTDNLGRFNITVDSDPVDLLPYTVSIAEVYFQVPSLGTYNFDTTIGSGQTQHVPEGMLELVDAALGDLKITILNGSSMRPLPHPLLNIRADSVPDPPFPTAKMGDAQGTAVYLGIRAVTTKVIASKSNFLTLEDSTSDDIVEVLPGVQTDVTFVLDERPWPFTTDPADGSEDVNHTQRMTVYYGQEMDPLTIADASNFMVYPAEGGDALELQVESAGGNTQTRITTIAPMEYNTSCILRIDNTVRTKLGAKPLWRAMEVSFTTELAPAVVSGRLVDSSSGSPVPGVSLRLKDMRARSNGSGHFIFPLVVPEVYTLEVEPSYLFLGTSITSLDIVKGEIRDLGDVEIDPRPNGSLEVQVLSGPFPLPGAWVHIEGSDLNLTTSDDGIAYFERTRTGLVTLMVGAEHHAMVVEQATVSEGLRSHLSVALVEDQMLVSVVPTLPLGGGIVEPGTKFVLIMPEPIDFSTLSVSLWETDNELNRVLQMPTLPVSAGEAINTYMVSPTSALPMERSYVLLIDMGLASSGSGDPLLWRDLSYYFSTPDYPLSYVSGKILLDDSPFAGLEVNFGTFVSQTGDDGEFNITVDLSGPTLDGILSFNGSAWGYESLSQSISITPGVVVDAGTIHLAMLPGRCTIDPEDGSNNVEPDIAVSFTFSEPVIVPEEGLSARLFLSRNGSTTPIPGSYEASNGNRTITFSPTFQLEESMVYVATVRNALMLGTGYPACPVGHTSRFTVRMPMVRISLLSPDTSILEELPLDEPIVLSFSMPVNRTMVESSLVIDPDPLLLRYLWRTSTELEIVLFMTPLSEYTLTLPRSDLGMDGQMGMEELSIQFTAGRSYARSHEERSFSILPDTIPEVKPGQEIRLNGLIDGSKGYDVVVKLTGNGMEQEHVAQVGEDGSWDIAFKAPNASGTYTISLTIGVPGAPSCIEPRSYTIEVGSEKEVDEPYDIQGLMVPVLVGLFILIIVLVAIAVFFVQRKRARETLENIDYDSVDIDMEE